MKQYRFILGVLAVALVGVAFPQLGAEGGPLRSEITTKIGVAIIFFIQGANLPREQLSRGLRDWKLHVFCQGWNFLLFPAIVTPIVWAMRHSLPRDLVVGFLFLAILPSTIASAVSFVAVAEGNLSGAVFNTALSNVAGVFIVPAWTAMWIQVSGGPDLPVIEMILRVAMIILAPLALGQLARAHLTGFLTWLRSKSKAITTTIIFYILYSAFSNSRMRNAWADLETPALLLTIGLTLGLLGGIHWLVWRSSAWVELTAESRVAAFFCGAQKTLASGIPLATSIFVGPDAPELAVVLIPLMLYHPIQLLVAASVAPALAKVSQRASEATPGGSS